MCTSDLNDLLSLLNAVVPSFITAVVSIFAIIYSSRKQKGDQLNQLLLQKFENLYTKLNSINSKINLASSRYRDDTNYSMIEKEVNEIVLDIEALRIESRLYTGLNCVDNYLIYSKKLLLELMKTKDENGIKQNINSGEYDKDDNGRTFTIVPSTFEKYYDAYDEAYYSFENIIVDNFRTIISGKIKKKNVIKRIIWNIKRKKGLKKRGVIR